MTEIWHAEYPWHLKVTHMDGTVHEDDLADAAGPVAYAQFKSAQEDVERVELSTVFVSGQQVSPAALEEYQRHILAAGFGAVVEDRRVIVTPAKEER